MYLAVGGKLKRGHSMHANPGMILLSLIGLVAMPWLRVEAQSHAVPHSLPVTIDRGSSTLESWMAQQRVNLTGAMRLANDRSKPLASSVRVWRCDDQGKRVQRLAAQFDVETGSPLVGVVTWPVSPEDFSQRARFVIGWSDGPLPEEAAEPVDARLTAERRSERVLLSNAFYRVEHDSARGGLWTKVTYLPSEKTDDTTLWRDGLDRFEFRHDAEAQVKLVASGPLRAVVEVHARYLDEHGRAPASKPRATYCYTYLPDCRSSAST
jgi:hypothetical protein